LGTIPAKRRVEPNFYSKIFSKLEYNRSKGKKTMKIITRIWHGITKKEDADEYLNYLFDTGIKDYRSIKGNLSTKVLRRIDHDICHFMTVTEWDSVDSIKEFAGEKFEKARYYKEDKKYLLEFEENVTHFETYLID